MTTILVTGGAGFIGSNFVKYMLTETDHKIINLDNLTYAGNLENLKDIENNVNYTFIKGDIVNRSLVDEIFNDYDVTIVVNFAAESHVDRSIEDPEIFLRTNVIGTQTLLDVSKKHWKVNADKKCMKFKDGVKFVQVSTDEVYGSLGKEGLFTESSMIKPSSPYSASKASADMLVKAYHETFGLPINITRCSNNYGPFQFPEKLIPLMINNTLNGKQLPVYGDGKQVRDWLHVYDHCTAIHTVMRDGRVGEVYNIGGNNEKENIYIVKLIIESLNKDETLIKYVEDRLGHDRRYAIDNSKISSNLGWTPKYTFESGIKETIQWYIDNIEWLKNVTSGDYLNYYDMMYKL